MRISNQTLSPVIATQPRPAPVPVDETPLDKVSHGVYEGANFANTTMGAVVGIKAGFVAGAAVSLGHSVFTGAQAAISGNAHLGLGTVGSALSAAAGAGVWGLGGAVVGGVAGGFAARGVSHLAGSVGASIGKRFGSEETGRAAASILTGAVIGGAVGYSLLGLGSTSTALIAGAAGGALAYFK